MSATSKPAWHAEALRLCAQGLSYSEIARRLGYTGSAVGKAVNPDRAWLYAQRDNERAERRAAKSAWDRECYRGVCVVCGAQTWRRGHDRCFLHSAARDRRWRRRRAIVSMWADGLKLREIAEALDTTLEVVGVEMVSMRRDGWDLPYRRPRTPSG